MWWLQRAGYTKMLCFEGLTAPPSVAYIPPVGRDQIGPGRRRRNPGETAKAAGQGPGWRKIATALADIVTTTRTGKLSTGHRPNRDERHANLGGRKAGDRREVGRPAVAR